MNQYTWPNDIKKTKPLTSSTPHKLVIEIAQANLHDNQLEISGLNICYAFRLIVEETAISLA